VNLYNAEHEKKLISALIYDIDAFDEITVTAEDFYDPRNAHVFKAIDWALRKGKTPDLVLLGDVCKVKPDYWSDIQPITAANIQFYVDSITGLAQMRKLDTLGKQIADAVQSGKNAAQIKEFVEEALTGMATGASKQLRPLKDLLADTIEQVEHNYKNRGTLPGVPTGIERLDFLTGGLQKGEFTVIGARPSGFFSLEQSQSPMRLLAAETATNIVNMRTGYLRPGAFDKLVDGCNKLANLTIWFDHHSYKLSDILSQSRRLVRMGCKVLFVDYLTLIYYGDSSIRTFERVGEISHSLKRMARELDIPLVVLSQLNREAEGKRPTLAELRMSGEIEQDADTVIFLHRDRKAETFETIVDIAKQRNGPVETFKVLFQPEFTKFVNMV